jgi:Phosphatidylethanolamine-binding protein
MSGDRTRRGMRRPRRAPAAGAAAALSLALFLAGCGTAGYGAPVAPTQMTVKSEAFISGTLAQHYTCHGGKINPPLNWSGAPTGTKSLALIVDDSSAPITGRPTSRKARGPPARARGRTAPVPRPMMPRAPGPAGTRTGLRFMR